MQNVFSKVFKKILIGGLTKDQLISKLTTAGVQFNTYAETLFTHHSFAPSQVVQNVKLVKVNLSDLGLHSPCSFLEIVNRASRHGLSLCPLYLGAYLRLDYLDQPVGPYLTIASAKPEGNENYPSGFYIRNFNNSLWLRG